jgi:hypothetical protein
MIAISSRKTSYFFFDFDGLLLLPPFAMCRTRNHNTKYARSVNTAKPAVESTIGEYK